MNADRHKITIYLFFFFSGISGLMYQVVWLRMFSLVMGVTIYAASTVVAAFMAGLALGSYFFGKMVDQRRDALRMYAILELLIAVTALLVPVLMKLIPPVLSGVHVATGGSSFWVTTVRATLSFVILLLPTTMMGGTLPVLTAHLITREKSFGRNFSLLYGLNTAGAVVGVLVSGFFTMGAFGQSVTVFMAVVVNACVASAAFILYRRSSTLSDTLSAETTAPGEGRDEISPYPDRVRRIVLIVLALSGFTALAYEVIWIRQLILFMRSSIYAFSFMLAVFLTGITTGSIFMSGRVDRIKRPLLILGIFELLIGLISAVNLSLFNPLSSPVASLLFGLSGKFLAVIVIVFPVTFLFGASMPIAAVCYAKSLNKTGRSVGVLYSSNTIGSIIGSLAAGFLLVPFIGSTLSVLIMAALNTILGAVLILAEPEGKRIPRFAMGVVVPALIILATLQLRVDPFMVATYQRISRTWSDTDVHYYKECMEGTVTAFTIRKNHKMLWINTEGMTKLCTETKLMTHLPLAAALDPKEMLVICFGMGTTVKSASSVPGINVTSVELVSELYELFGYYHPDKPDLLSRPNVHPVVGDGRNYLLLTSKKFDAITIDPAPPIWSPGSDNLYTREFMELCKQHLNPGGAMCAWFPLGTAYEVKSVLKSYLSVFPYVTVYHGPNGWGYYMIGTLQPLDQDTFKKRIEQHLQTETVRQDLGEYDRVAVTADQISNLLLWTREKAEQVAQEGRVITDDRPLLQFPLWRYLLHQPPFFRVKGTPSKAFLLMH
jgi:spermidine synthase